MSSNVNRLKENARKLRKDVAATAEAAWDVTVETAEKVAATTRQTVEGARKSRRMLELKARKAAVKAASKVEKVSHDFKEKQLAKRRKGARRSAAKR